MKLAFTVARYSLKSLQMSLQFCYRQTLLPAEYVFCLDTWKKKNFRKTDFSS